MHDHWKHFGPPVYISVAAYLGLVKPRKEKSAARINAQSAREFMQLFQGAGGAIN